jgi:hypothetical protein
MAKKPDESVVVPMSRFRRQGAEEVVPEVSAAPPPPAIDMAQRQAPKPAVDLTGRPTIWFLLSSNGGGKTTLARWLIHRAEEAGREQPLLAALDPGDRTLASWFSNVEQPPNRDTRNTARWLRDYLDGLMAQRLSAILDFGGGGETALARLLEDEPRLHEIAEEAGVSLVACYPLTTRVTDIFVARGLEDAGFQPRATLLLLNEGRSDPTRPAHESFATVTGHSAYRRMIARGAQEVWMPPLDEEVIAEVEKKWLTFAMARDGLVPEGAAFFPIGGLRRSSVGRFLALAEQRFERVRSWLP